MLRGCYWTKEAGEKQIKRRTIEKRAIRFSIAAILVLMAPLGNSASETAYVIIKATILPEDRPQPIWISICLVRGPCIFVSAEGPILDIDAGTYEITHLIIGENTSTGAETLFVHQLPSLVMEAGSILVYGNIEVDMTDSRDSHTSLDVDMALLRSACEANPGIFDLYPVVNAHNGKKGEFVCNSE